MGTPSDEFQIFHEKLTPFLLKNLEKWEILGFPMDFQWDLQSRLKELSKEQRTFERSQTVPRILIVETEVEEEEAEAKEQRKEGARRELSRAIKLTRKCCRYT